MLRLAADENFNGDIVRGPLRRNPKLDIIRIQDVGLSGAGDSSVQQWAAAQGRVVITHDISILAKHALDRVVAGQPMPGVFEVRSVAPIGQAIDDFDSPGGVQHRRRMGGQVRFLPLSILSIEHLAAAAVKTTATPEMKSSVARARFSRFAR
jgi:hypothetical protein